MFFKSYSNDGTLLQLTPDSVFKFGSVTRYWGGTVTRCYYMDRLRNKKINNLKKTSLQIWRWISYRDCRNVSWQWLVTRRVAWASGVLNSVTSPRVSWLPATEFWLICFNKSFILMWFYHMWQNEWLFWYQCLCNWR